MCNYCGGSRRIGYNVPVGHPLFGRTDPCPKCNQQDVTAGSGLQAHEREITLASLMTNGRPGAQEMMVRAKQFIANPNGFLSFYGDYGNGKTVALMAIVNACLEKGISARYLTAHTLMDYLYEAFDPKVMETDRGRISRLATVPVLVIDELEKARDTPYAADMQFHLIDQRYRNSNNLGTVFAWNGDLNTLPWPAVISRIREFPIVENRDQDMRPALGKVK